jgi:hypothetical protein
VGQLLKIVVELASFKVQTTLDGADTTIWLAASPEVEGGTGKFWNKRRDVRCRVRGTAAVEQLWILVEQQAANDNTSLSIQGTKVATRRKRGHEGGVMMQQATYPVQFSVDYPDRPLGRLATFFRIFMVIPIAIVLGAVAGGPGSGRMGARPRGSRPVRAACCSWLPC